MHWKNKIDGCLSIINGWKDVFIYFTDKYCRGESRLFQESLHCKKQLAINYAGHLAWNCWNRANYLHDLKFVTDTLL